MKIADEVGEAFMEPQYVRVCREAKACPHPIEHGVGHFVGDDVVRQAGKHPAMRHAGALGGLGGEEAEVQLAGARVIEGVLAVEGMRANAQHRLLLAESSGESPRGIAAERFPEHVVDRGADRINHLLVELPVGDRRRPAVPDQNARVVGLDRIVLSLSQSRIS